VNLIKTADQLPKDEQEVLAWARGCFHLCLFHVLESSKGGGFFAGDEDNVDPDATEVSHWMPLPAPPDIQQK
jgi:hypothetical protein